jgi:hypothetical protein
MTFFAERPGWHVQSDGRCLAFWQRNRIVRAVDRRHFLAEILAAYRMFADAERKPDAAWSPFDSVWRVRRRAARVTTFCGLVLGVCAAVAVIFVDTWLQGARAFVNGQSVYFALLVIGMVVGAYFGRSLPTWPRGGRVGKNET